MSNGYSYDEPEPFMDCPYCGKPCHADFVDVGVGMIQCGPYHCEYCYASEIGPNDKKRELTLTELDCGWYFPNTIPGDSANVIDGKIVSHKMMKYVYQKEFTNNPLWEDKEYMDSWWKQIRGEK